MFLHFELLPKSPNHPYPPPTRLPQLAHPLTLLNNCSLSYLPCSSRTLTRWCRVLLQTTRASIRWLRPRRPPRSSATVMPATAMFSNLKSRVGGGAQPHNPSDSNPISQYFEIGKVVASAGPEHIWKIHDAYRKSDGKVRSNIPQSPYITQVHTLQMSTEDFCFYNC